MLATAEPCSSSQDGDADPAAVLLLADGTLLRGRAFGARGTTLGEVVFNTGIRR